MSYLIAILWPLEMFYWTLHMIQYLHIDMFADYARSEDPDDMPSKGGFLDVRHPLWAFLLAVVVVVSNRYLINPQIPETFLHIVSYLCYGLGSALTFDKVENERWENWDLLVRYLIFAIWLIAVL